MIAASVRPKWSEHRRILLILVVINQHAPAKDLSLCLSQAPSRLSFYTIGASMTDLAPVCKEAEQYKEIFKQGNVGKGSNDYSVIANDDC